MMLIERIVTPYVDLMALAASTADAMRDPSKIADIEQVTSVPADRGVEPTTWPVAVEGPAAEMWKLSLYRISPMKAARDAVACLSTSLRSFLMSDCDAAEVSLPSERIVS